MNHIYKPSCLENVIAIFLLVMLFVLPAGQIRAANPIAATEFTQIMNNGELVALFGKEAEQLAEAIKTYQLMYEQAKRLPDLVKRNAINSLINLARSTQSGMAISYAAANISEQTKDVYKSFEDYQAFLKEATSLDKQERFKEVFQSTHDTVTATLKNAGLQAAMFEDEAVAVAKIQEQMSSAAGTNQILQAGVSMAAANVEQHQKLRQLIMGQTNMLGSSIAADLDQRAKEEAAWSNFLGSTRDNNPDTAKKTKMKFNFSSD